MVWEAALWALLQVGDGIEAIMDGVLPAEWTAWYRTQIADWGLSVFGALSRFVEPGALAALGAAFTFAFGLLVTQLVMRFVRAVRSWLP